MLYLHTAELLQSEGTPNPEKIQLAVQECVTNSASNKAEAAFKLAEIATRQAITGSSAEEVAATLNALDGETPKTTVESIDTVLKNVGKVLEDYYRSTFHLALQEAGHLKK